MPRITHPEAPLLPLLAPAFSATTFVRAQLLGVAAILTTGRRTIANWWRTVADLTEGDPSSYHRVLSLAQWSGITAFGRRFPGTWVPHGWTWPGVSTAGSPRDPEPLGLVCGEVPHPMGAFHIRKELTQALGRAVAQVRKRRAADKPTLQRGRPATPAAQRAVRRGARRHQQVADRFEHRQRFVPHVWTPAQRPTRQRCRRGWPHLRTLRTLREEVEHLWDRRGRSDTALAKLAKRRPRVRRFQAVGQVVPKRPSPHRDQALTFVDDQRRPSTSQAVEGGHRRQRKRPKTVERVRTQEPISHRSALDRLRDAPQGGRTGTLDTLHHARSGRKSR